MADQSIKVVSPLTIVPDSKARVAFELMEKIDNYTGDQTKKKDKKYWFSLYCQCYKAVDGAPLPHILQDE